MRPLSALSWDKLLGPISRALLAPSDEEDEPMPANFGKLPDANGVAQITGPCGDTMAIWLRAEGGSIVRASFATDGCWPSIASGSCAARLAEGRTPEEAAGIEQQDVLEALGGLPKDSQHCALLAATTLKAAVADYQRRMTQA